MKEKAFDAIILGYGPVGATAANMLICRGWKVAIVDRMEGIYPYPRAVHCDAEIMRVFQELGVAQTLEENIWHGGGGAEFVNSKRECINRLDIPADETGRLGWFEQNFFHQPLFERALRDHAEQSDLLTLFLQYEAAAPQEAALQEKDAGVFDAGVSDAGVSLEITSLSSGEKETLYAPYLLAADGAASGVRKAIGAPFQSLGYDRDWLVMDVILKEDVALPPIPQQICDPARRQTFVPLVGRRRRWEFRMNEGETRETLGSEEMAWRLLRGWGLHEGNCAIERRAVYQFHAAIAEKWRAGGVFLMGDAAHQMPPFLGQGMCSGIRDAANLCWKLDMVKCGTAPESLLETYQQERYPHALDYVDFSMQVGKLMDRLAEAEETGKDPGSLDAIYGGTRAPPHLHGGVLALGEEEEMDFVTGFPAPQPKILAKGAEILMDDAIGARFAILSNEDMSGRLGAAQKSFLEGIGAVFFPLPKEKRADAQMDFHLEQYEGLILRPDRYVFGVVNEANPLPRQIEKLQRHFL